MIHRLYDYLRARVYLWALEYVVDYQHSKPPLTILGGGREWPICTSTMPTDGTWKGKVARYTDPMPDCICVDPSNLKPEDRP